MRAHAFFVLVFVACGSNADPVDAGSDAAGDANAIVDAHPIVDVVVEKEAGFAPGPHAPFPQSVNAGGSVVASPNVIPVFFANDAFQPQIEDFLSKVPSSAFWSALRTEYAVGPLTVGTSIVLADTPPAIATIDDVAALITAKLDANDPAWPAPNANNIYYMYYPSTTTLYDGTSVGCTGFGGYHSTWHTTTNVSYLFAVTARCTNLATLDLLTFNASHELVEATTDPYYVTYSGVDEAHAEWNQYPGSELGDLCETEPLSYQRTIGSYEIQRFWSNASAKNGHDPCVPVISAPYYNAVPVLTDDVTYDTTVTAKGVTVPLGTSRTIDVQLFSDAETSDWTLQAQDSSYLFGGATELTFSWDTASGNNGDTRALTITRVANGASGATEFVIFSTQSTSSYHAYYGIAGN